PTPSSTPPPRSRTSSAGFRPSACGRASRSGSIWSAGPSRRTATPYRSPDPAYLTRRSQEGPDVLDLLHFVFGIRRLGALRHWAPDAIAALQQQRWRRLLQHARRHSPFYRRRLLGLDLDRCRPADVPPLSKAETMANFDELVTDRRVTRRA